MVSSHPKRWQLFGRKHTLKVYPYVTFCHLLQKKNKSRLPKSLTSPGLHSENSNQPGCLSNLVSFIFDSNAER